MEWHHGTDLACGQYSLETPAVRKVLSQSVLLCFKQEDICQDLAETSLSPWLLECDCYANICSEAPTDLQIT